MKSPLKQPRVQKVEHMFSQNCFFSLPHLYPNLIVKGHIFYLNLMKKALHQPHPNASLKAFGQGPKECCLCCLITRWNKSLQ